MHRVMKIVALSAANIWHNPEGTSFRLARMVFDHISEMAPEAETELVALVDKEIAPCVGCGRCATTHRCLGRRDDFQSIYGHLLEADGLVIVSPHYAPIPAKFCALLERVENISFLGQHNDEDFAPPFAGKLYGVIGHAGGPPELWNDYYQLVFVPIKNALGWPVGMIPIDTGEWPHMGAIVGPSKSSRSDSVFPVQQYDQALLEEKTRLVAGALVRGLRT